MAENNDLNINSDRSPFTKPDNKRRNLHSEDVKREEISKGDPSWDTKQEKELREEPWKKDKQ
ncbi:MAG: hypothetical protein ACLGHN_02085 [Bacteriovoracia bacterium]